MRRLPILLVLPWGGLAQADVSPFRTPSGNIHCTIGIGEGPPDLYCTIYDRSGPPALPRPADCSGAWGHHFVLLSQGGARVQCGAPGQRDDSPGADIADYGVSADWGGISCHSSRQGLECRNEQGHGFFLSRARQSVF